MDLTYYCQFVVNDWEDFKNGGGGWVKNMFVCLSSPTLTGLRSKNLLTVGQTPYLPHMGRFPQDGNLP